MKQMKPAMKNTNACIPGMGKHITTMPVTKRPGTKKQERIYYYKKKSIHKITQRNGQYTTDTQQEIFM
jgi:hypothetical protein